MVKFNDNAVKEAAYFIWQNAGCPMGQDEYFWSMAVEQLSKNCKSTCKASSSSMKKSAPKKVSTAKKKSK